MFNEYRRIEVITGEVARKRWATEWKLRLIENFEPGETVTSAARHHGVAPNLLYRLRGLFTEGGTAAADSDEPVAGNSEVKKLEDRVRELEPRSASSLRMVTVLANCLSRWGMPGAGRGSTGRVVLEIQGRFTATFSNAVQRPLERRAHAGRA